MKQNRCPKLNIKKFFCLLCFCSGGSLIATTSLVSKIQCHIYLTTITKYAINDASNNFLMTILTNWLPYTVRKVHILSKNYIMKSNVLCALISQNLDFCAWKSNFDQKKSFFSKSEVFYKLNVWTRLWQTSTNQNLNAQKIFCIAEKF